MASSSSQEDFPRWFGDYLLLKELGAGGMGQVFVARLPGVEGIDRLCVVKTLKARWSADREYIARFVDEARVVVHLAHKNICAAFDVGAVQGTYYLAMDLVPGRDLTALFTALRAQQRTLPPDLALYLGIEIVDALDAAHRLVDPVTDQPANLVHRDVSPHNVLLSFDGDVKLIDFGLAHSSLKNERTEPGIVLGKLAYMAPEHARGDKIDRRADLFAVAVVLYELLVGERFWEGFTTDQVWRQVGRGTHKPEKLQTLPAETRKVLERALEPDPRDRYANGTEMRQALTQAQLARGAIAGSADLRAFLEELFPHAAANDRRERAALQRVPAPSPNVVVEESVRIASASGSGPKAPAPPASSPPASPPRSLLVSEPATPATFINDDLPTFRDGDLKKPQQESTSSLPQAPVIVAEPSEPIPTELVRQRPQKKQEAPAPSSSPSDGSSSEIVVPGKSKLPLLAAIAGLAIACGVVIALVSAQEKPPQQQHDAGVVVAAPPPPPPAEPLPVIVDAGVAADVVVDAGVVEPVPVLPKQPHKEPKKELALPPPAEMPRGLKPKVALLAERCAKVSCTRSIVARFKGFERLAPAEVADLQRATDDCLRACRNK